MSPVFSSLFAQKDATNSHAHAPLPLQSANSEAFFRHHNRQVFVDFFLFSVYPLSLRCDHGVLFQYQCQFSGRGGKVGVIGDNGRGYSGPEVGVFQISLETPPKEQGAEHLDSFDFDEKNSTFENASVKSHNFQEDDKGVPQMVTPPTCGRKSLGDLRRMRAPKRPKGHGRADQLSRYIHKYECEDFMEYSVDIDAWKRSQEEEFIPGPWEAFQGEVTPAMRSTLLQWTVEVARGLDWSLETWSLASNYLDRFLAAQLVSANCLQLVGVATLWLAAKQQELEPRGVSELAALAGHAYSAVQLRQMELLVLARLHWRLAAPTPAFHLAHLVVVEQELDWPEDLARHMVRILSQCKVVTYYYYC